MTTRRMPPQREPQPQPPHVGRVDAGRLWSGGAATAVVAGLIALVGVLVARWLLAIPLLSPKSDGAYGDAHTTEVVLVAVATVLVVIVPFRTTAPVSAKLATAVVGLVIGIAIGTLLTGVASRSVRSPRRGGGYTEPPLDNSIPSDLEY